MADKGALVRHTRPFQAVLLAASFSACAVTSPLAQAPSQLPPTATQAEPSPAAAPADVASMDAILAALYDVISGPAGAPRDWGRFRSLFAPGARLVPLVTTPGAQAGTLVLTPNGYVERSANAFAKTGFYEKEVARRVESFGGLTHVWSTYEARRAATDVEPFLAGVNSIQLVNDGQRWWILTVAWQAARPDLPLPEKYRKQP